MKVFLSYPARSEAVAREFTAALRQVGMEVWAFFDQFEGDRSDRTIVDSLLIKAIEQADVLVSLITPEAARSRGIANELAYARLGGIPVLPVLLHQEARIPFGLLNHDIVDVTTHSQRSLLEAAQRVHEAADELLRQQDAKNKAKVSQDTAEELFNEEHQLARIFIAYSRKQQSIAKALSEMLTRNGQLHFWDAKIHAGAAWRQTIQQALVDCTHLIVIWTLDAAKSDEVEREVSYALAKGKVIIPLLSVDTPELPYHLFGFQHVILKDDISAIEHDIMSAIRSISSDDIWQ